MFLRHESSAYICLELNIEYHIEIKYSLTYFYQQIELCIAPAITKKWKRLYCVARPDYTFEAYDTKESYSSASKVFSR